MELPLRCVCLLCMQLPRAPDAGGWSRRRHNWMDGDIDVQAQNGTLSAYWSGFYDFEATISHYLVAVGTGSSGAELEDVVAFTNVGRVNAWTSTPEQLLVTLAKGVKYFVTVRAGWCVCLVLDQCASQRLTQVRAVSHTGRTVDSSSDGVVIGIAPPMPVEAGWVSMRGIPLASTDRTTCGCSIANAEFSDREGRCRCRSGYALNLTSTPEVTCDRHWQLTASPPLTLMVVSANHRALCTAVRWWTTCRCSLVTTCSSWTRDMSSCTALPASASWLPAPW